MRSIRLVLFIAMQLLMVDFAVGQVTVFPQGLSQRALQVHDSISPFTEFKITHGLNTGQGIKMRLDSLGDADLHNRLGDLVLKAGAIGPGAQLFLEEFGNIGIGYPKFPATHALHINGIDPLRLQGLTNNLSYDTILVVSPTGVVHKRAQNTFPASFWTKSGNYVFNTTDSIGIGVSSPSERLYVQDAMKVGSTANNAKIKLESDFIKSEFGQYKFGTSELLLKGKLAASGLTYLIAKKDFSDLSTSQGLLLNVEGAKPIIFATNDKEAMRIDSLGYLRLENMYANTRIQLGLSRLQVGRYLEPYPYDEDLYIQGSHDLQLVSSNTIEIVDGKSGGLIWATFDNINHRLGIDTLNPAYLLHVNGNAAIEDTLIAATIQLGVANERFLFADAGGIKIHNNSPYTDNRSNISIKNGYDHLITIEKDQILFNSGSIDYLKFDGPSKSISINGSTTIPRETLDVVGNAIIEDTLLISGFNKTITGKGGALEVFSDEPINITANLNDVTISDGIFPYAIFEGSTRNFGLLNSGPVTKKLEVGGSGLFHDSIFVKTLQNTLSSTNFDQLKIESGSDILLAPAANKDVVIYGGGSTLTTFKGSTGRVGIGTTSPQEKLEVNGTIETNKIKITDGAIPGRFLISDGNGLGSWAIVPPDGDWTVTGSDMQSGVPGNIQVGAGIVQNSKWNVNGSIGHPIKVVITPTYALMSTDFTVVLTDPTGVMATLPPAGSCAGRIYKIKFMANGGSLLTSIASDLIDNIPMTFAVPPPTSGIATTMTVQSDGIDGWWILN